MGRTCGKLKANLYGQEHNEDPKKHDQGEGLGNGRKIEL